jgi:predicted MPP superfamily phosphohydrolase
LPAGEVDPARRCARRSCAEAQGTKRTVDQARAGGRRGDPAGRSWPRGGGANAAPDIERTLGRVPASGLTVALAHNPVLWPDLARSGVALTLSGHTHYGQLAIPHWGWNIASTFLDLSMGIHRQGDSLRYISLGTNYWGVPLRIGTPPEVTVLTLRRGHQGEPPAIDPTAGGQRWLAAWGPPPS